MSECLTPIGDPPDRSARWCPRHQQWTHQRTRRCLCGAALVRQARVDRSRPGELRPGIVAEFHDPRDRYDPSRLIASLRAHLLGTYEATTP